jgi:hypothetical protein
MGLGLGAGLGSGIGGSRRADLEAERILAWRRAMIAIMISSMGAFQGIARSILPILLQSTKSMRHRIPAHVLQINFAGLEGVPLTFASGRITVAS